MKQNWIAMQYRNFNKTICWKETQLILSKLMRLRLVQFKFVEPIVPEVRIQKAKHEPVGNRVKSDSDLPWKTIRLN